MVRWSQNLSNALKSWDGEAEDLSPHAERVTDSALGVITTRDTSKGFICWQGNLTLLIFFACLALEED